MTGSRGGAHLPSWAVGQHVASRSERAQEQPDAAGGCGDDRVSIAVTLKRLPNWVPSWARRPSRAQKLSRSCCACTAKTVNTMPVISAATPTSTKSSSKPRAFQPGFSTQSRTWPTTMGDSAVYVPELDPLDFLLKRTGPTARASADTDRVRKSTSIHRDRPSERTRSFFRPTAVGRSRFE